MPPFFIQITRRPGVSASSKVVLHMSRSRRWRTTGIEERKQERAEIAAKKMENKEDYTSWSNEKLIERVSQLEAELKSKNQR
jgi:hypothetical protein